jgi:uncharacterized protein YyaL (SSP411 family)
VTAFAGELARNLVAHAGLLAAALDLMAPQLVLIISAQSKGSGPLAAVLSRVSSPGALQLTVSSGREDLAIPALEGKFAQSGSDIAFLCLDQHCLPATSEPTALMDELKRHRRAL